MYINVYIYICVCVFTGLKFQHFLLQQIKCRGNYVKIHFAAAFSWYCLCGGFQDFILRALTTLAKTLTRSKLVRLHLLLHISPRIRSIMCTIQFKLLKDHQYTFKVRHHPLFVALCIIIITICFMYMANNRFTLQSLLL